MRRVCAFLLGLLCSILLFTSVVSAQAPDGDFTYGFVPAPPLPAIDLVDPGLLEIDCIQNDGPSWPAGSFADHFGDPGATTTGGFYCTLQQNDPCTGAVPIPNPDPPPAEILGPCTGGSTGAQGWQMSFRASGCNAVILDITATQTDVAPGTVEDCEKGPGGEGGFDNTELTTGAGNEGAVTAIVLHLKKGTTLDPSGINFKPSNGPELNPLTVCRFLVTCENPAVETDTCDLKLEYIDGLEGSGQPVDNKVTQDGQSVVPSFVNRTIQKTALPPPATPCDQVPDQHGLGFSAQVIDSADYYDFAAGLITGPDPDQPASGGTHTVVTVEGVIPTVTMFECITVGPQVPLAQQPQGWQLATELTGPMVLTEVSVGGTALYALGNGPSVDGFDVTEIISPAKNAGREGFVSGVVLHLKKGTTIDELASNVPGTAAVIRIELTGEAPQGPTTEAVQLRPSNGLIGSGQSVDNKLTIAGASSVPCNIIPPATADVAISLSSGVTEARFIRGDANDDGKNNLADAVWILNGVFRNPPHVPAACEDASDANNDGTVDPVVDAAFIIAYQFTLGPQPPAPFPNCGADSLDVPVDIVTGLPDPLFPPPAPDDMLNCAPGSMSQCP